jgi:predicted protein tyrosine phosphatase
MRLLFVCNQNQNRSSTAEALFKSEHSTRSAGLYCENPVTEKELVWADAVVVMEDAQRTELGRRFPSMYLQKRIISLDIPDVYRRDQPELKQLLIERLQKSL